MSRASSGVATSMFSASSTVRMRVTCSALDAASWPGPIHRESSRPTRTLAPIAAPIVASGIWLRPAPRIDQRNWSPNRRCAVRCMCIRSSGSGPMPPRMPNTDWMKTGPLTRPRSKKWRRLYRWLMS
ncbi:hypothetical protein D9M68_831240 [compost metagenome]